MVFTKSVFSLFFPPWHLFRDPFSLLFAPKGVIWPPLGPSWRHLVCLSTLFGATLAPLGLWHDWWSCPPVTRGLTFGLQDRKRDWRTCAMGGICTWSSLRLASLCFALLRSDWIGLDNTSKDFGGIFQRGVRGGVNTSP